MNTSLPEPDRLLYLVDAVCSNVISDDELRELDAILLADPASHEHYLDYCHLHIALGFEFQSRSAVKATFEHIDFMSMDTNSISLDFAFSSAASSQLLYPVDSNSTAPSPVLHAPFTYLSSGWPAAYLIATVICAIGAMIGNFTYVSQPALIGQRSLPTANRIVEAEPMTQCVGRITGMVDCRWNGIAVHSRDVALGHKYELASGLMEIAYDTGAKVILQGPVAYMVKSKNGGFLPVGRLTVKVEGARAKGFVVHTPTAIVTDLGTEFGVEVSKQGATHVQVFQGVVEARKTGAGDGSSDCRQLREGEAIEIGKKGGLFSKATFAPQLFTRKMPQTVASPIEAAYMKAVLADRPMGYWPLNESAGAQKFLDRSGNAIDGYAMGKPAAGQSGPFGDGSHAVAMDGNEYIDLGRRDQFAMPNNFTVEAWAWIGETASRKCGYVVSAIGEKGDNHIGWGVIAGRDTHDPKTDPLTLYFIVQPGFHYRYTLAGGEMIENRWLHLAVAVDEANTVHLYLNGVCRGEIPLKQPSQVGPVWLQIGTATPEAENMWRGRLAHVAVYPHVLSAQQINDHYRRGTENTAGTQ